MEKEEIQKLVAELQRHPRHELGMQQPAGPPWELGFYHNAETEDTLAIWPKGSLEDFGSPVCLISPDASLEVEDVERGLFIVKACNMHQQLVDIIRELTESAMGRNLVNDDWSNAFGVASGKTYFATRLKQASDLIKEG